MSRPYRPSETGTTYYLGISIDEHNAVEIAKALITRSDTDPLSLSLFEVDNIASTAVRIASQISQLSK